MVRVLHCVETIGSGGVEQRRLLMAKYLDKGRFSQFMVCSNVKAGFDQKLNSFGMPVYRIGSLRNVFDIPYYFRLINVVREVKPDIIHGAVFEGVISAVVAGLFCRIPHIVIEETSDPINRSRKASIFLRILSVFAKYVVAISPSVKNYLLSVAKIQPAKIRLINNGVDVPAPCPKDQIELVRQKYQIKDSDFVIGSVGRLRDFHKRFSDLIKAIPFLVQAIPNLKLLIVGGGNDLTLLQELAKKLDVQGYVIFAGFQKDTAPFYSCMNIFSLVSHMEGFGLVVVEAMFFKLPVVVTSVGGMKDIVSPGVTGFLVDRYSPEKIANAISILYQDEKLRNEMGQKGFEIAMQEYSASVYIEKVNKLYEDVLIEKESNV